LPSRYLIYALQDPLSWELRYVGRSSSGMDRARAKHLNGHCGKWFKWLERRGHRPLAIVLQEFPETTPEINGILNDAEIFWVSELRRRGCPLTNCTAGGAGQNGYPRVDNIARNKARIWTPEMRETASRAHRGFKASQETRAKMAAISRERRHSPETRAKMSATHKAIGSDPELRAKRSAWMRGRYISPETIEKSRLAHLGKRHTPEARAKMSATRKGKMPSPQSLANLIQGRPHSEATRQKLREAWYRRHPEYAPSADQPKAKKEEEKS
jgi:hypothetical protein